MIAIIQEDISKTKDKNIKELISNWKWKRNAVRYIVLKKKKKTQFSSKVKSSQSLLRTCRKGLHIKSSEQNIKQHPQ